MSIKNKIFISNILLVFVLIGALSYRQYTNQLDAYVKNVTEFHTASSQSIVSTISSAIAGENYANIQMPNFSDELTRNNKLIFMKVDGLTDYSSQVYKAYYSKEIGRMWRGVYPPKFADDTKQKISSFEKLMKKSPENKDRLQFLRGRAISSLQEYKDNNQYTKNQTSKYQYIFSKTDPYIDFEKNILSISIKTINRNGGKVKLLFDISEIQDIKASILEGVLIEYILSIFFAIIFLVLISNRITKDIDALSIYIDKDFLDINVNNIPSQENDDEIGILARKFNVLLDSTQKHISQIEDLNKSLSKAKDEAEEATKTKSAFLANMSHEIRTPMNAILGFVDILAKGEVDKTRSNHFKIIQESSQSLLTIINDILDISKIESGKLITEKEPINTKELFENSVLVFDANAKKKNINFKYAIEDSVPDEFLGDSTRIKQVVFNLLSNAIKFTDEGGTVSLDIKYDNSSQYLYCYVSDSGIGIAPKNISKIFNAFEQEDSSTTRKFGGTGLGLAISSKLISIMGGELNVQSVLGEGSKFYFSIPAGKHIDREDNGDSMTALKDNQVVKLSGKVLLVDDTKTNQMLLGIYLDDLDLEYDIANNGQEAVEKFEKNSYDVILMDEQMPVMSGTEATKYIRNLEEEQDLGHIHIIAVTANALADDRKRLLESGMDDYLSKPIDIDELERVLRKVL